MAPRSMRGIYKGSKTKGDTETIDDVLADKVADFSYESENLAHLITELWSNKYPNLINGTTANRSNAAKTVLETYGMFLTQPIVITEAEYEAGFSLEDEGLNADRGVVFVLPDPARRTPNRPLLETAKLLMALTPHGI